MNMQVDYKKDLYHNYMIITETEETAMDYCIRLLHFREIDGILPVERRTVDGQTSFYYDITAKLPINHFTDKLAFNYEKIYRLFMKIIDILERADTYLLVEDDFLLSPEYIFMDVVTEKPHLCYLSGYAQNIREQMRNLLEYLMNVVNYNDKNAVLLVYHMHAASREQGFTMAHLKIVLNERKDMEVEGKEGKEGSEGEEGKQGKDANDGKADGREKNMKEDGVQKENEIFKSGIMVVTDQRKEEMKIWGYPMKTYFLTGLYLLGGVIIMIASIVTKAVYRSYGSRMDYCKLCFLLLLLLCGESYLIKNVWDKKNKG